MASLTTSLPSPSPQVCTEGRFIVEFTFDDLMRIKSWHFATRGVKELIPRSVLALHAQQVEPALAEQLGKNITRQGLTNVTLNYLRVRSGADWLGDCCGKVSVGGAVIIIIKPFISKNT